MTLSIATLMPVPPMFFGGAAAVLADNPHAGDSAHLQGQREAPR